MANGRILRGEVYWVSVDDSVGSEIQTGRPAVVISGNKANELLPTVIIAYITSQGKPSPTNVSILYFGEPRRVLCNQIRTIDKQRLTRYEFTLTESEMIRVTGALAGSMCIPLAMAKKEEPAEDPEKTALKAECEMWKRLYNVTMDQLVEIKVTSELSLRMAKLESEYEEAPELEPVIEPEPVIEEEPEPPKVEFEPEPELTEINSCTYADLKRLGFSTNIALTIIEGRPYKTISDLRKLAGMTSIMYQLVEKKIKCEAPVVVEPVVKVAEPEPVVEEQPVVEPVEEPQVEQPVEKVNINTATAAELRAKLGINGTYSYCITGHRIANGRFVALEELLEVKGLPRSFYERYKDRVTIGEEPVQVVEEPVDGKVNINTASGKELIEKLGMPSCDAYTIVGHRKRNGDFASLEDLLNVKAFSLWKLNKYRDRITVGSPVVEEPEEEAQEVEVVVGGKLNINTATVDEIVRFTQISHKTARNIVAYRNKNGPFKKLDDLVNVSRFGAGCMKLYGDMLTVGESEDEEKPKESGKVNLNQANIYDLMKVGFEKRTAALIVNERKKYGNYRSVDELSEIDEISGKVLRKLRDKLEV